MKKTAIFATVLPALALTACNEAVEAPVEEETMEAEEMAPEPMPMDESMSADGAMPADGAMTEGDAMTEEAPVGEEGTMDEKPEDPAM